MKHFISGNLVSFDTETTGLYPWLGDQPYAFSFCNLAGQTAYFQFDVDPLTRNVIYTQPNIGRIGSFLGDATIAKVGHNIKFDIRHCEQGPKLVTRGEINETEFLARIANPTEITHALKPLCKKYGGLDDEDLNLLGTATKACRFYARAKGWKLGPDPEADYWMCRAVWKAANKGCAKAKEFVARFPTLGNLCEKYATLDAVRTIFLYQFYTPMLEQLNLTDVYRREMLLWPVIYAMESRGVRVDVEVARKEIKFCEERCRQLRKKIEAVFGEFNKEVSGDKLRKYLFSREKGCLALPYDARKVTAKKKEPSVKREILEKLIDRVPVLADMIDFDKHGKASGDFFSRYIEHAGVTGILHANFQQIGAKTARFSCREPNLQQVPKRAKKGEIMRRVRSPFGPRDGYVWLHSDYKAIEARLFAEHAEEDTMCEVFASGEDIYQDLVNRVSAITSLDLEMLLEAQGGARQVCKNNFLGWTYGEGTFKMSNMLGIPSQAAELVILSLQQAYPKAMPFMERMQELAIRDGQIINRYGRAIPIPPPVMKDGKVYRFYYRAVNYLIQSTAADMMKAAMLRCANFLGENPEIDGHIVMTIHDELVFEIPREHLTRSLVRTLQDLMEDTGDVFKHVQTPTDVSITTQNWDDPTKLTFPRKVLPKCQLV